MRVLHNITKITVSQRGYTLGNLTFFDAICGFHGDNINGVRFTVSDNDVTCKKCLRKLTKEQK